MSKYTPGPWRIKTEKRTGENHIISDVGTHIAIVSQQEKDSLDGSNEANANLLAAAPDLLAALIELEENAANAAAFMPHVLLIHAVEQARMAIAKSKGKL